MIDQDFGNINIKILDILNKKQLSKNKLAHLAQMERTQLNRYCNNQVRLVDLNVLARLCTALDCNIDDILEYVPANATTYTPSETEKES